MFHYICPCRDERELEIKKRQNLFKLHRKATHKQNRETSRKHVNQFKIDD